MKIPEAFVGGIVAVHLARPVYMFTYSAHLKAAPGSQADQLYPEPLLAPAVTREQLVELAQNNQQVPLAEKLTEVLIGTVLTSDADAAVLEIMVPDSQGGRLHLVHKAISNSLILSADRIVGFDIKGPEVDVRRAPERSRIVTP